MLWTSAQGLIALLMLAAPADPARVAPSSAGGVVEGQAVDVRGGVLPGATVSLREVVTDRSWKQVAQDGSFRFEGLPPGRYELSVSMAGFALSTLPPIEISGEQRLTLTAELKLQFSEATETVAIIAGEAEDGVAQIATHLDFKQLAELPVGGRTFTQAATVQPGVLPLTAGLSTHGGIRREGQAFSANGQRPESNNYVMDDVKIVNRIDGGIAFKLPSEAISDFQVSTSNPLAEHGGASGAVVNVYTRSGGNRLHANLYGYARTDALASKNYFAREKEPLQQSQFGATVGGPLGSDSLSFFAYYEGFRNRQGLTRGSTVPTEAERAGDFSSLPYPLIDRRTGQAFLGNVIPQESMSPLALNLLKYYPAASESASFASVTRLLHQNNNQAGARLDWRPSTSDTVVLRYALARTDEENPFSILGSDIPDFPVGNDINIHVVGLSQTHIFGHGAVNTAHAGFFREHFLMESRLSGLTPRSVGFAYDPTLASAAGMPFILVSGYSSIGDPAIGPRDTTQTNWEIADTLSLVSGRHRAKFGIELRRVTIDTVQGHFANGSYQFDSQGPTRSAFANFLLGGPSRFTQAGGDFQRNLSAWEFAVYAQDRWQPTPRLTLDAGLRYEINTPFREAHDKLNAFAPGRQSTVYPDAPPGVLFPGDEGIGPYIAPVYYKAIAPRVGAAWDVTSDGRTVLRAAYGIFYDALSNGVGGPLRIATQSVPWIKPRTLTGNVNFEEPFAGLGDPFGANFPSPSSLFTIETNLRPPYSQQWNLVLQRSAEDWTVGARYIGTKGTRLPRFIEANPAVWQPGATAANADRRRIYSGVTGPGSPVLLGNVALITNSTNSTYHAGQLSLSRRPVKGFSFSVTYTLSKLLDYVSSLHLAGPAPILTTGDNDLAQNPFDLLAEHGPSLFDARHRVTSNFSWDVPVEPGPGPWRALASRWSLSGILTASSGTPFTVYDSTNVSLQAPAPPISGVFASRPNLVGDPNAGPHTPDQWVSRDAFQRLDPVADAGKFGNAGRNIVRGPGHFTLDLVLAKSFPLGSRRSAQFRVEFLNATNQTNFALPVTDLASPNFGRIIDAGPARVIQFGLRLQL
jgi:hypothetical protein